MSTYHAKVTLMVAAIILLAHSNRVIAQRTDEVREEQTKGEQIQSEKKSAIGKTAIPASYSQSVPKKSPKTIDPERTVALTLVLGANQKPGIIFGTPDAKSTLIPQDDLEQISKKLLTELAVRNQKDGILIRVSKNVDYKFVDSLYKVISSLLVENRISKPIYMSVQDPKKLQQDETTTREIVFKNQKASEYYDRVANVAITMKVAVVLDPSRNSITAKGPAQKVKVLENLIAYLDRGDTGTPKVAPPNNSTANNPPSKNPPSNQGNSSNPPVVTSPNQADSLNRTPPVSAKAGSNEIGRYQLTGVGDYLFLLDTATGESWYLDASSGQMAWIKLPFPAESNR